MDKKYIELFRNLAQSTAASAESVMDYDREKGDEKGLETATTMRNDFQELADNIKEAGDNYAPTKNEVAKLLVASMIMVNQLQDKANTIHKAISGYQTDLIPKLQEIMDATDTDNEAVRQLANKKFIIENEN